MAPFRSAAFRRLWASSLAATTAQGMERTATAWLALEVGAGALEIGLLFAARMLPSLLFGLAAGTLADRGSRARQLAVVAVAALLLTATFGGLALGGGLRPWHVILFGFLIGSVQVFDIPARQALVLDTVPKDVALSALSLNALAGRLSSALGAFGGGALIALVGVARSYAAVAACYGLAALLVAALRAPHDERTGAPPPPFRQALRDAARLTIDVPAVRVLIVAGLICEIFAFSHASALPLFAQDVLGAGPGGLGTLNAAQSVGGAVAVALLSLLPERTPRRPLLGATFLVYGLAIVALAATRDLAAAAAMLVVTGLCAGAFDVLQQTLIQMSVPPEQRGRAVGVWVLSLGSAPLGHLEMGALIAALGVPAALLINGGVTAAAAAALLARAPAFRLAWRRERG